MNIEDCEVGALIRCDHYYGLIANVNEEEKRVTIYWINWQRDGNPYSEETFFTLRHVEGIVLL